MNSIKTSVLAAVALALLAVLLVPTLGGRAGAAEPPTCTGRTMLFVAHEDDDLLFIGPRLQQEIHSNRCIRTVFLTAGDDGKPQSYWGTREEGVEAAYAQMAGVADAWTQSTVTADGHTMLLKTLTANPRLSVVFFRLPDGGFPGGTGTPMYGNQSLMKLWNGGNPCSGCAEESTITAVDNSNTFTYNGLIETLSGLMGSYGPRQIFTQNFEEVFFNGDHPDHVSTARFTKAAAAQYTGPHRLTGYIGYNTESRPANVSGELLLHKSEAFYAYGAHDTAACSSPATCVGEYETWLAREYVAGRETIGVVANAAFGQEVSAGAQVTLNGTGSSDQSGAALTYEWTQVGGPSVTLNNPTTAKPTFTMIGHPILLTFALTVNDGTATSDPDYVQIRVPTADPAPTAIAGPPQTVGSHATVHLDGSASWDPNSLPLEYEWKQTAGPAVTLIGPEMAKPSFVAPVGPAEVTLSLVVSNGTQESAPSTVTIEVLGFPPNFTNATSKTFTAGTFGTFTFTTEGSPAAALFLGGELPPGVEFHDNGNGTATLSGTASKTVAAPGASRNYPVDLEAINEYGEADQSFTLTVNVPAEPSVPKITSVAAATFTAGSFNTFTFTTEGTPVPGLLLTGELPPGAEFHDNGNGTATLSGTPPKTVATPGTSRVYPTVAKATNEHGEGEQSFQLTVAVPSEPPPEPEPETKPTPNPTPTPNPYPTPPASVAPAFTNPHAVYGYVGRWVEASIATTGTPVPSLSLNSAAPAGLTFAVDGPGTARLAGKVSTAGTYKLALHATNAGGTADQQLRVVIDPLPKLSRSTVGLRVGRSTKQAVKVGGSGVDGVRCQGKLPAGIRCVAQGKRKVLLSGKPGVGSNGTYKLRLRVSGRAGMVNKPLTLRVST